MGASATKPYAVNHFTTAETIFTSTTKDFHFILHVSLFSVGFDVGADACTFTSYT
jgi:hypothetical protein